MTILYRSCQTVAANARIWRLGRYYHKGIGVLGMDSYLKYVDCLPESVREYVLKKANICQPQLIHVCDGSEQENRQMIDLLLAAGAVKELKKYENCWLVRTDPADVARVESKTFISTPKKETTIPFVKKGVVGKLGNWMSPAAMDNELNIRFPGCMRGRTMFVIPFSMGPIGGELSKIGIELTDSPYVVMSMRIMTRMGREVLSSLGDMEDFVKAIHSVGVPLPTTKRIINGWPCDPERTIIAHIPARNEICSFGSGYGGNSLLGKKCFALRIGSILGHKEGWLAEHMLIKTVVASLGGTCKRSAARCQCSSNDRWMKILGITSPNNTKRYVTAAFPSACGKTNLAMLEPTLPGYKIECVGDDIAWMKFNKKGELRAINPEAGFFGVAPGTSYKTNPNAMKCITKNTIFTNVAETSDGGVFWEGMEEEIDFKKIDIIDWQGKPWDKSKGTPAAHPNSRFCTPASQCPIIDSQWESSEGVPISAIIFGGRRPQGVPLVYEAFDWAHGIFVGAAMRSEATAAAEYQGKMIMNDPFAMRPFFGYNFGDYLKHWLSFGKKEGLKLPHIYHVNWFRKSSKNGKFLWPGYGENARVLEWILQRLDGVANCKESLVGNIPDTLNVNGLQGDVDFDELFSLPIDFWQKEAESIKQYFDEQVGDCLPNQIGEELVKLQRRIACASADID